MSHCFEVFNTIVFPLLTLFLLFFFQWRVNGLFFSVTSQIHCYDLIAAFVNLSVNFQEFLYRLMLNLFVLLLDILPTA